jgi:hypothetical protein
MQHTPNSPMSTGLFGLVGLLCFSLSMGSGTPYNEV